MLKKTLFLIYAYAALITVSVPLFAQNDGKTPLGANTAQDLYSPGTAGRGGFTTSKGGAPAAALNPAAEGDAQRIILNLGYLALPALPGSGSGAGFGNSINLGAMFPTRVGVFGGSVNFLQSPFDDFPVGTYFGGNLNAAKEIYPGMNLGLGLNLGYSTEDNFEVSADLGFRHNLGKLGPLEDFTYALVLRGMGLSWIPSMFTPAAGLSFDFLRLKSGQSKPDPLRVGFAADLYVPTFQNLGGKAGLRVTIAELVMISASTQFNIGEAADGNQPSPIPSIGVGANIKLKSGGRRLVGGSLPSDGELAVDFAAKPLYENIWAMGGGLTWTVGVMDSTPPEINADYPETLWISPNNDGKADALEFPVEITDQRYVSAWTLEISDVEGNVVRTYRNKERRPETQGVQNFISRLTDVKSGVEVPSSLRWDGVNEAGAVIPDGKYLFTITSEDDNGNTSKSPVRDVMVRNTAPVVTIEPFAGENNIFSPDGDGNKDTLAIVQSGSKEELWEGAVYDALGEKVKTINFTDNEPSPVSWDGTNNYGEIVPDGVYTYRISATDPAQNTGNGELGNIIVNTIHPQVNLTITDPWFSPNRDDIKDSMGLTLGVPIKEGILNWEVLVKDIPGNTRRAITGEGLPPSRIDFDGRGDSGTVLGEGIYTAALSVHYRNGYVSSASSPAFNLDISSPRAVLQIEEKDAEPGRPPIFAPMPDSNKGELVITQEGSNESGWIGEIRRAGETSSPAVRSFRFTGIPPARVVWDGTNNSGLLATDGIYVYELFATDQAGNSGRSNRVEFELFTKDTPVFLTTDLRAFSPNGDGVRDALRLLPQLQETGGVSSWKLDIQNIDNGTSLPSPSSAATVRSFEGRGNVPTAIPWDGKNNSGAAVKDGTYFARLEVEYRAGTQSGANSRAFVLDTAMPQAALSVPYTIFAPNGNGRRETLPINVNTEGEDEWNAVITDAGNNIVRSWNWTGRAPAAPLEWDAKDQAGNMVPNGTYTFALSSTDEAGNSTRKTLNGITVDARIPRAFLTASAQAIAPKPNQGGDSMRFAIMLNPQEGIESWKFELKNDSGRVLRSFSGTGGAPPSSIAWNGTDDQGIIREGRSTPALTVNYVKGDELTQSAPPVLVDISGPILGFNSSPRYFSPDNDGVDDELIIALSARDASPISDWSLEIRETEGTNQLFYRIGGRGSPSERIVWDGRSNQGSIAGELIQGASDYSYTYNASDSLGNSSSTNGIISTDVLVIRDGDMLKIQVPSITFRANAADFNGLPAERIETNIRVLRRVAEILNKFRDYRVMVEGHANPVLGTAREENEELQPLSEARSSAVIEYLVSYGVSRSRLSGIGRGGTRTVVSPADQDNRWKNRRVEFILNK